MSVRSKTYLFKSLLFLLIFFLAYHCVSTVLARKDAPVKMADFYSESQDFDVLFFGSSHPQYAVLPMELWQNYGFTSYNLAVPSERLDSTYYNLRLAVQETHPKVVVVDVFTIDRINKNVGPRENPHYTLDLYPASLLKAEAIKHILGDDNLFENELEYLLGFPLYHNRWEELTAEDFNPTPSPLKGAETSLTVATDLTNALDYAAASPADRSLLNLSALEKIISFCHENNIALVLTYLPNTASEKQLGVAKAVAGFTAELALPYLNYLESPINDYATDFMDSKNNNAHLNLTGAKRLTSHLGAYLAATYNLPDHRQDPAYASWHTDYVEYLDYLKALPETEATDAL